GGTGGRGGLGEPGFCFGNPGGKGGSPKPGGGGGSLVTSVRQVSRSAGDISFQRQAFFRNSAHSSGVMLANLRSEAMQFRRCSGGSLSNNCSVVSISCRSESERSLSVFAFSFGDSSKNRSKRSHIRWRRAAGSASHEASRLSRG